MTALEISNLLWALSAAQAEYGHMSSLPDGDQAKQLASDELQRAFTAYAKALRDAASAGEANVD